MACVLPLVACDFPHQPTQTVRPIDKIEMTDPNQGPFVAILATPLATRNAYKAIIGTLFSVDDLVGSAEA